MDVLTAVEEEPGSTETEQHTNSNQTDRLYEAELIINLSSKSRVRKNCIRLSDDLIQAKTKSERSSEEPIYRSVQVPSTSSTRVDIVREPGQPEQGEVLTIERRRCHECMVCKKTFTSFTALLWHRVKHNEEQEKFACDICGKRFKEPRDLDQHKYKHMEVRIYRCGICNDTFDALENFKFHLRIHDNDGPYVCNICSQVFNKKNLYISHHYEHESIGAPPRNICKICNKIFPELHKFKRHMMYHNNERSHKCTMCDKTFVERSKLTRHMLIHTRKREFLCPVCGQGFSLKCNMMVHVNNIHKGCRNHKCPVCQRTFTQKVVLQRHMKIHLPA